MNKKNFYKELAEIFLVCLWIAGFMWLLKDIAIPLVIKSLAGLTFGMIIVKLDSIYEEVRKIRKQGEKTVSIGSDKINLPLKLHSFQPEIDKLNAQQEEMDAIIKQLKPETPDNKLTKE